MAPPSLLTLDHDVVYQVLILTDNLTDLRHLILTHPVFYRVFSAHRRLVLKHVFGHQTCYNDLRRIFYLDRHISRCKIHHPIDRVAFREAIWPEMEPILPSKQSVNWASALLIAYGRAGLLEEAVSFAERTMETVEARWKEFTPAIQWLARSVVQTYKASNRMPQAVAMQEEMRRRLDPKSAAHETWSKELAAMYGSTGNSSALMALHLNCWELYKKHLRPENTMTLHWARSAFRRYQLFGDETAALAFHEQVRVTLTRSSAEYRAWSRQQIKLLQRHGRDADALTVMEEVWRNYDPEDSGYRAWAGWLCEHYNKLGRYGASVIVWETTLTAINRYFERHPTDRNWKFHARGAALDLAKAYRRAGNSVMASKLETEHECEM